MLKATSDEFSENPIYIKEPVQTCLPQDERWHKAQRMMGSGILAHYRKPFLHPNRLFPLWSLYCNVRSLVPPAEARPPSQVLDM